MPTQAERTAAARRRLLDAATELIAELGCAGTSVAAIGQRAGMSRGAVNFHFVSKDALLTAVAQEVTSEWQDNVFGAADATGGLPLIEQLDAFLEHSKSDLRDRPARSRTMMILAHESMAAAPLLHEHFLMLHRNIRTGVASLVRHRQASGELGDEIDADAFALMVISLFRGMTFQYLLDPAEADLDRGFVAARRAILGYLQP